jgi:hypothetical protein
MLVVQEVLQVVVEDEGEAVVSLSSCESQTNIGKGS